MKLISAFVTAFIATSASCATPPCDDDEACEDEDEDEGKADGTDPTGSTGRLRVHVPVGVSDAFVFAKRPNAGTPLLLTPGRSKKLAPGTYCVWTQIDDVPLKPDCAVVVEAQATTTYRLGAFEIVRDRDELVWGVDELPLAGANARAALFGSLVGPAPHAAGSFTYSLDTGPNGPARVQFDVSNDATTVVDLTRVTEPAVRLLPATGRTLPNLPPIDNWRHGGLCRYDREQCIRGLSRDKPLLVVLGSGVLHWYASPSGYTNLQVDPPATAPITDVQLRRIDFNHVRVTVTNGTIVEVPGRASAKVLETSYGTPGRYLLDYIATGYGADVPPAKYLVRTDYIHPVDGTNVRFEETLDLR